MSRVSRSIEYRFNRLKSYYWQSSKFWLTRLMRNQWNRHCARTLRSERPQLYATVADMLEKRGKSASDISGKYSDVLTYYRLVRELQPSVVVECGAGVSTLGVAAAVRDNHIEEGVAGKLYALDENKSYLSAVVAPTFPAHLRPYLEFIESPTSLYRFTRGDISHDGICYTDFPDVEPDLIIVDGPQTKGAAWKLFQNMSPGHDPASLKGSPFDCDALRVAMRSSKPIRVIVDMRIDGLRKMLELAPIKSQFRWAARKTLLTLQPGDTSGIVETDLSGVRTGQEPA